MQPAPGPRFSRTPGPVRSGRPVACAHTAEVLREFDFSEDEIAALQRQGSIV